MSDARGQEGVDATLGFVEACPASCAFVFTVFDWAGAGHAADAAVALGEEGVCGELVLGDVCVDLLAAPGCEGIELEDVAVAEDVEFINLQDFCILTGWALLAADSCDPDIQAGQFFLQGEHFAQGAAEVGIFFPEVGAEFGGLFLDGLVGVDGFDGDAEAVFELLFEGEGFGEKEACIEGEDGKWEAELVAGVQDDDASSLETGSDGGAWAEALPAPAEDGFQGCVFKFLGEAENFLAVDVF